MFVTILINVTLSKTALLFRPGCSGGRETHLFSEAPFKVDGSVLTPAGVGLFDRSVVERTLISGTGEPSIGVTAEVSRALLPEH